MKTLQSECDDIELVYSTSMGQVKIGKGNSHFFQQFKNLPPQVQLEILNINEDTIEKFIKEEKVKLSTKLQKFFKYKWVERIDDSLKVDFNDDWIVEYYFGIREPKSRLLYNIKTLKYSIGKMRMMIDVFEKQEFFKLKNPINVVKL